MAKPVTGTWDEKSKRYYARVGERNPTTNQRKSVMLRYEDGRPIGWGDKGAVAAAVVRLLADREAKENRSGGPTVIEVVNSYIDWHIARGSLPSTIQGHRDHLGPFCEFEHQDVPYGYRRAASMTLADLTRMRKAMEAKGLTSGYIKNRYSCVLACWRWAARPVEDREPERLIDSNPFDGVERPKRNPVKDKAIPYELIRVLIRFMRGICRPPSDKTRKDWPRPQFAARDWDRTRLYILAFHMAVVTGCRPGEAAQLRWDEIDWKEGWALLSRGKMYSRTHEKRVVFFPPRFLKILKTLKESGFAHPTYVYMPGESRKVLPPTSKELGSWFKSIRVKAIKAGIHATVDGDTVAIPDDLTVYWMRHSYSTDGTTIDKSLENLSQLVGNSPGVMRNTYRHTSRKDLAKVADAVAKSRRSRGRPASGSQPDSSPSS